MTQCRQQFDEEKFLLAGTFCFDVEKPEAEGAAPEDEEESKEDEEKDKGEEKGVKIDVEDQEAVRKAREAAAARQRAAEEAERRRIAEEKRKAEALRKKKLTESEKALEKKGAQFFKIGDLPGLETSQMKSEFSVDIPEKLDEYKDENGRKIKPRIVFYCHGNNGEDYNHAENAKLRKAVEEMRANGDPVILVAAQDNAGGWKEFDNPDVYAKIIEHTEKLVGEKLSDNVSLASFSGGYKCVMKTLMNLQKSSNPRAQELYKGIRQIGFLDSFYDKQPYADSLAQWASEDSKRRLSLYWTDGAKAGRDMLEETITAKFKELGKTMENINIPGPDEKYKGGHSVDTALAKDFLKRPEEEPDTQPVMLERDPRAMSGKEFQEAYEKVQEDPEAIAKLVCGQVALGNFPPSYRFFEEVTVKAKDGTELRFNAARRRICFGETDETAFEIPLDGPTSHMVADMMHCTMATEFLSQKIFEYAQEKGQVIPLFHQADFMKRFGTPAHDGSAMKRIGYFQYQQKMIKEYMESQNPPMKYDRMMAGYFKDVIPQFADTPEGKIRIFGGYYADGSLCQKNRAPHGKNYKDYSHGSRLIAKTCLVTINGKTEERNIADLLKDQKFMDKFREEKYSKEVHPFMFKAVDIDQSYKYTGWRKDFVEHFQKAHPPGSTPRPYSPQSSMDQPIAAREAGPPAGAGVPVDAAPAYAGYGGGGGHYGGGGYGYAPSTAPSADVVPASYTEPTERARSHVEVMPTGKIFTVGDSLSHGFFPRFDKKLDATHVHPPEQVEKGAKAPSGGQTTDTMVGTVEHMLKNYDCKGATLVIVGGSNDIFQRDRNNPTSIEKIKRNLTKIYNMVKGPPHYMKVVGSVIPPPAHSERYSGKFYRMYSSGKNRHEDLKDRDQYERELVERWQKLNAWILGKEGAPDGPDEVIDLPMSSFEDPNKPGKLHQDVDTGDGVHLNGKGYTQFAQLLQEGIGKVQESARSAAGGSFEKSPYFGEETSSFEYPPGTDKPLHVHINKAKDFDPSKKTEIIMYGCPAGNTISHTIGTEQKGLNSHYYIQHVGAQVRMLREKNPGKNIVVAYVQAGKNGHVSGWLKRTPNGNETLASLVDHVKSSVGAPNAEVMLDSHSAGGGLQRGIIEKYAEIPDHIKRINFFDSLHFIRIPKHAPKILKWLQKSKDHRLNVLSYEDTKAKMDFPGKGLSEERSKMLRDFFEANGVTLEKKDVVQKGGIGYYHYTGLNGQINMIVMKNPHRNILHTETVRRNGLGMAHLGDISMFNKDDSYQEYRQEGKTDATPRAPAPAESTPGRTRRDSQKMAQNSKWRGQIPKGATGPSENVGVEAKQYLGQLKMGETARFTKNGKTFIALKEYHGPNSGHNYDHPGVSVFEVPSDSGDDAQIA